jgi:hypothetical protein
VRSAVAGTDRRTQCDTRCRPNSSAASCGAYIDNQHRRSGSGRARRSASVPNGCHCGPGNTSAAPRWSVWGGQRRLTGQGPDGSTAAQPSAAAPLSEWRLSKLARVSARSGRSCQVNWSGPRSRRQLRRSRGRGGGGPGLVGCGAGRGPAWVGGSDAAEGIVRAK